MFARMPKSRGCHKIVSKVFACGARFDIVHAFLTTGALMNGLTYYVMQTFGSLCAASMGSYVGERGRWRS